MDPSNPNSYSFGFTSASLRPELTGLVAEVFAKCGSWEKTHEHILETNALQCRSKASGVRLERELRQRLETLSPAELELLLHGALETRVAVSWLAAVKRYAFLFDFVSERLRSKIEHQDTVLRVSDYEVFVEEKATHHPEVERLSDSTSTKIRQVMLRMLREVGILREGSDLGALERPLMPYEVEDAIRGEDARWLGAFLIPDSQI